MGITVTFGDDLIVYHDYVADIYLSDILSAIEEATSCLDKAKTHVNVLVDLLGCSLKLQTEDTEIIATVLQENKQHYAFEKIAILTDNPKNTALSVLFENAIIDVSYCKVFSTKEMALEWLSLAKINNF